MRHDEALHAMHALLEAEEEARKALPPVLASLPIRLVNTASWEGPPPDLEVPEGAVIVNAARSLDGLRRWFGPFRGGCFYAAALCEPGGVDPADLYGWKHAGACRLVFITNGQIRVRVAGKLAEHGYSTPEDACTTGPELAADMQLPWNDGEPWDVPR
jgi:hypothetical protein